MTLALKYRNFPNRYIRDPRLGHRLGRNYPNKKYFDTIWGQTWLGTNSNGFYGQSKTYKLVKKIGSKRVLILGGSAAMGLGATDRKSVLANLLEERLNINQNIVHYEVLNCAVGDYSSTQSLLAFQTELLSFEPDVVVMVDGFNDFSHSLWGSKFANGSWLPNSTRSFDDCVYAIQKWENPWNPEVLKYRWKISKLGATIRKVFGRQTNGVLTKSTHGMIWDDFSNWSIKDEAIVWYVNNLKTFIGMSNTHHFKLFHFIQPNYLWTQKKPLMPMEATYDKKLRQRMSKLYEFAPIYYNKLKISYNLLRNFVKTLDSAKQCVYLTDWGDLFDDKVEEIFADPIHYNDRGQKILANEVAAFILRL